jgi:hypothetical protein
MHVHNLMAQRWNLGAGPSLHRQSWKVDAILSQMSKTLDDLRAHFKASKQRPTLNRIRQPSLPVIPR